MEQRSNRSALDEIRTQASEAYLKGIDFTEYFRETPSTFSLSDQESHIIDTTVAGERYLVLYGNEYDEHVFRTLESAGVDQLVKAETFNQSPIDIRHIPHGTKKLENILNMEEDPSVMSLNDLFKDVGFYLGQVETALGHLPGNTGLNSLCYSKEGDGKIMLIPPSISKRSIDFSTAVTAIDFQIRHIQTDWPAGKVDWLMDSLEFGYTQVTSGVN